MDLTSLPRTDPLAIYRHRDGLYAVDLLTAALTEFDFGAEKIRNPATKASGAGQ